nr:uncharacterized protein LOC109185392 [Ipomoea batatas]
MPDKVIQKVNDQTLYPTPTATAELATGRGERRTSKGEGDADCGSSVVEEATTDVGRGGEVQGHWSFWADRIAAVAGGGERQIEGFWALFLVTPSPAQWFEIPRYHWLAAPVIVQCPSIHHPQSLPLALVAVLSACHLPSSAVGMGGSKSKKVETELGPFSLKAPSCSNPKGISVRARTEVPVSERFLINCRWGVNFPEDLGTGMPHLSLNKIEIEMVDVVKEKRELNTLQRENREMKLKLEEFKAGNSQLKLEELKTGNPGGDIMEKKEVKKNSVESELHKPTNSNSGFFFSP